MLKQHYEQQLLASYTQGIGDRFIEFELNLISCSELNQMTSFISQKLFPQRRSSQKQVMLSTTTKRCIISSIKMILLKWLEQILSVRIRT